MSFNIIGDIAGNIKTLKALLEKMPDGELISVGDMIDRGPSSKEVLEFVKENGRAVLGNHDHFLLDACTGYKHFGSPHLWIRNGGWSTLVSFKPDLKSEEWDFSKLKKEIPTWIPEDIVEWVKNLPLYIELPENANGLKGFISHAPKNPSMSLEKVCDLNQPRRMSYDHLTETSIIWNRGRPKRIDGTYQIFGHNSHWGLTRLSDDKGEFAICIDTSQQEVLTGFHWPSGKIYQQENID